jgi:hypothetical protein
MWRAFLFLPLLGCAVSDLGVPCDLSPPGDGLRANQVAVRFGAMECESGTCVATPGEAGACTLPCLDDSSCASAGMVCRPLVLTPEVLAALETQGTWLGTRQSSFCVRPATP